MKFNKNNKWKVLIGVNLFLGMLLWFAYFTDYSLPGTVIDFLFPPAVAIVSLISLLAAGKNTPTKGKRLVSRLSCIPSLIGGCSYTIISILAIPVFMLGFFFAMDELSNETLIQRIASPDGSRIAEVYFRPVGAYSGGNGRISIRVKYRLFPFVERDVYHVGRSYANESTTDYLSWVDNDTLFISEKQHNLSLGIVKPETPLIVHVPVMVLRSFINAAEEMIAWPARNSSIQRAPIYPDSISYDSVEFDETQDTVWRSFQISGYRVSEVAEWYQDALSQPPWFLIQVNTFTSRDWTNYCICAKFNSEDNAHKIVYFVELSQSDNETATVFVIISTPNPLTDVCSRYHNQP